MRETIIKQLLNDVAKKEDITNYNYEFATGLNKKDGFVSSMFQVKLNGEAKGEPKILKLMIKFAPSDDKFREDIPVREMFKREIFFYKTYAPLTCDLLVQSNLPMLDFITKSYAYSFEPGHEAIVFDNLKDDKYELWDYTKPMNHEHIKYVLGAYGKLHGTGFALKHTNKELYEKETRSVKISPMAMDQNIEMIKFFRKSIDTAWKGLDKTGDSKLLEAFQIYKDGIESFIMRTSYEDDQYFTILHGDCWCNNVMFKYANELSKTKPTNAKLLDWQMLWNGPPVMDITYSFYANASSDMYEKLNEYKDIYYESLSERLKQLGHDPNKVFPRQAFEKQMKEFGKFGMTMCFIIFYIRLFKSEIKDHEDLQDTDENVYDQFACKEGQDLTEYYKLTNTLIRHCFEEGYF